jgi:excisionase family DNA binding protein
MDTSLPQSLTELPARGGYELAMKVTGLPRGTLSALVCQHRIPHHRKGPRLVIFDRDELNKWVVNGELAPPAPKKPRAKKGSRARKRAA